MRITGASIGTSASTTGSAKKEEEPEVTAPPVIEKPADEVVAAT
jgi:hypothetical protein